MTAPMVTHSQVEGQTMKITRLFLVMLMLTVSAMAVQSEGSRLVSSQGGQDSLDSPGSSNAPACEWFDIYCSNGITDECCGDVNSCLVYCSNVCGEPCAEG